MEIRNRFINDLDLIALLQQVSNFEEKLIGLLLVVECLYPEVSPEAHGEPLLYLRDMVDDIVACDRKPYDRHNEETDKEGDRRELEGDVERKDSEKEIPELVEDSQAVREIEIIAYAPVRCTFEVLVFIVAERGIIHILYI